jgi:hypothetical protein
VTVRGTSGAERRGFRAGVQCVRIWFWTVVTLWTAVACTPAPEANTVSYYREHLDARDAQLRACAEDPGSLHDTPNCINARESLRGEGRASLRNLPPMELPVDDAQKDKSE